MNLKSPIELFMGDITTLKVDAIVNAANQTLLGGGGVDGAIHRAAGPQLLEECRNLGGCPTGQAKLTRGYGLPAKYVIHTVGPVWQGGTHDESQILAQCYRNCLDLASVHGIKTIGFPNISTGVYGFPKEEAARIALREVGTYLSRYPDRFTKIIFALFDQDNVALYSRMIGEQDLPDEQEFSGPKMSS